MIRGIDDETEVGFEPLGETTLLIRFGDRIDAALNASVHRAAAILRSAHLPGVVDMVPAFATLALVYAPTIWSDDDGSPWQHLAAAVRAVFAAPPPCDDRITATIEIPVSYGGEDGPDLAFVAHHCGLSEDEVVARHVAADYRVAMLGFAPGFPYLLGLDSTLHTPRHANPRTRVPRGSVAIGGGQTGIYPSELPGGWHLLGRTPLRLFDPLRDPVCLLASGDFVRFRAINAAEFSALTQ